MIDTAKVTDRRKLHFANFDEVIRDVEELADAQRNGTLRATGNWTLGQAIGHVNYWARAPFEGYPEMRRPPWWMRAIMPLMKPGFLNKGLPAGVRLPEVPDGTFGVEPMSTGDALAELKPALERLAREMPPLQNPMFAHMSHQDWIKLNLRHAELHFSFFHPGTERAARE